METPQFKSDEEFFAWTFKKISESITNLAKRIEKVEEGMQKIPPPGADMVKYKIPGNEHYSNLRELFGTIFQKFLDVEKTITKVDVGRINEKFDSLEESRENILDENAVDNMVVIRISEYLEGIEQRLNKIESKLGI